MKKLILVLILGISPLIVQAKERSYWDTVVEYWTPKVKGQYETTVDYWSPKVKNQYKITVDYWTPKVKRQYKITADYWSPIIEKQKKITYDYWKPRLKTAWDASMLYFAEHILPKIRSSYKAYMDGPGEQITANFLTSFDYLVREWKEIKITTIAYYKVNYPIQYAYLTNVPAFVKIGYEKFIINIWKWLNTLDQEHLATLSDSQKASLGMAIAASQALENRTNNKDNELLDRLLNELRPYVKDYGMQDCYLVTVFEEDITNAFNLGCNIFFSKDLLTILNNDERLIRAVIAHEVAHGDRGHGLKTMGALVASGVQHFAELTMEELIWLATGDVHQTFGKVINGTPNGDLVMERFSPTAPAIEIDADIHATHILEEAGFHKDDLIDALKLLHQISGNLDCHEESITGGARHYPTYCARKDAINKASTHHNH